MVQIGSAIGSTIGQWTHLTTSNVRTLVTCGAAGGIAATFNAPIAAAMFAMEVLMGRVHTDFLLVLLTSLSSCMIARYFLGNFPAFLSPVYDLVSPAELPLYFFMGILIGMPAAVALFVLAIPLVATVFYRGAMTADDVLKTSAALQAFTIGLLPLILTKISAPGYFARQDTATPFKYAAASVAVNIVASLSLYSWMGHVGIALATSLAAMVHCTLLFRGLFIESVYRPGRRVLRAVVSAAAGSAVMVVGLVWLGPDGEFWLVSGEGARIGELMLLVLSASVGYFLVLALVGIRPNDFLHRV